MLSVIITAQNEPLDSLERTIQTLRNTQSSHHEVILMDDASELDYSRIAKRYDCILRKKKSRTGQPPMIDEAAGLARGENLYICDAHMSFDDNGWDVEMQDVLSDEPNVMTCHASKGFDGAGVGGGARIVSSGADWLEPKWASFPSNVIQCPLGASYGIRKSFHSYIGGIKGIGFYGCNEAFWAAKIYGVGGTVRLLDSYVRHNYAKRPSTEKEERRRGVSVALNKAIIYWLLFEGLIERPESIIPAVYDHFDKKNLAGLKSYLSRITSKKRLVAWLKGDYFQLG